MRAAKKLRYDAENDWARNVVGEIGRMRGYKITFFASFHREGRKSARALPATLPKAVQNGDLPEEPLGTIAEKISHSLRRRKGRQHCHGFPMPAFGEFTESGHDKFIHWEVMKTSNKHRINLALSPDNPLQKEALAVLTKAPPGTRTTLICQALCAYQNNEALVEKLRSVIREELSKASIQETPKSEPPEKAVADNRKALDLIRSLQGD